MKLRVLSIDRNLDHDAITNANFFSDDTIPGQNPEAFFPFPTVFELVPGIAHLPYLTLPRLGSPTFPAARAAKLTGNQAAAQFLLTNTNFDLIGQLGPDFFRVRLRQFGRGVVGLLILRRDVRTLLCNRGVRVRRRVGRTAAGDEHQPQHHGRFRPNDKSPQQLKETHTVGSTLCSDKA